MKINTLRFLMAFLLPCMPDVVLLVALILVVLIQSYGFYLLVISQRVDC